MKPHAPLVSFVVPTKNAGRTLEACLASIVSQDYPSIELIVVDHDDSSDSSIEIAQRYADTVVRSGPERSAQRNHGARLARGDVVVFIDADMVLETAVARACVDVLARESRTMGLVLPEVSFGVGYFARCRALEKELYLGDDRVEAARAFRREAFEAVGGYDETLTAFEDWDLADRIRAMGWNIGRITARVWHDDGVVSPLEQLRKKWYYGRQSGRYLARRDTPRLRPLVRTSLVGDPRLLRQPILGVGLVFLKLCEATGVLLGGLTAIRRTPPRRDGALLRLPVHGPRVLHVVGAFDANEGMGRSMIELAIRAPGEHHLMAARIGAGAEPFASAHAIGGSTGLFPLWRTRRVRAVMRSLRPDIVHFHGGPLVSLWTALGVMRAPQALASIYVWPRVPTVRALRRASVRAAVRSQVLRPRVIVGALLGPRMVARLLRRGAVEHVLTSDPSVVERLAGHSGIEVVRVPCAVGPDHRRAQLDPEHPVLVFAGRGETVRGVDTLLDAIPMVRAACPNVRVRLLLLARPEVDAIVREVWRRHLSDIVEVSTDPIDDLHAAFAEASVAVFPFKFDHVTLPPALTAAEAMAVGLPVVGTDVECITAILRDDENGAVVPVGAPRALADAIIRIVDDPVVWQRLSNGALRTIEQAAMARTFERVAHDLYGDTGTLAGSDAQCVS
jgi:glycosyltransferase involved in cell wall biosynthesis